MTVTWGEIKKAIDFQLEDSAKIKEIRISELYYRGVRICLDKRQRNSYVIINETKEKL